MRCLRLTGLRLWWRYFWHMSFWRRGFAAGIWYLRRVQNMLWFFWWLEIWHFYDTWLKINNKTEMWWLIKQNQFRRKENLNGAKITFISDSEWKSHLTSESRFSLFPIHDATDGLLLTANVFTCCSFFAYCAIFFALFSLIWDFLAVSFS